MKSMRSPDAIDDGGRDELAYELDAGLEREDVVEQADSEDEHHAAKHAEEFGAVRRRASRPSSKKTSPIALEPRRPP